MEEQRQLRAALTYATKYGWKVFPVYEVKEDGDCSCPPSHPGRNPETKKCGNAGKHPRIDGNLTQASTDPKIITKWWSQWPNANIGLACGPSGVLVVDIDTDERSGGQTSLAYCEDIDGPMPDGPRSRTGSGGEHRFFKLPTLGAGQRIRKTYAPGIDLKGHGGYVVLAPSNHPKGKYDWLKDNKPKPLTIGVGMVLPLMTQAMLTRCIETVKVSPTGATGPVLDSLLGAAFQASGDAWFSGTKKGGNGDQVAVVRCPWEDEHTSGSRFNGSTIVWPPTADRTLGHFQCSHSHCAGKRTWQDVLAALPKKAVDAARVKVPAPVRHDDVPPPEDEHDTGGGGGGGGGGEEPTEDWQKALDYRENGKLKDTTGNAALLLHHAVEWAGVLALNEFSGQIVYRRTAPLLPGIVAPDGKSTWKESHLVYVSHWLSKRRGMKLGPDAILSAVQHAAQAAAFDPLVEALNALVWDGTPRLDRWAVTYLGVDDCLANDAAGRLWLIGAAARALRPACQMDYTLVIHGEQGGGKSTVGRVLALDPDWHLGSMPSLQDVERAAMKIQGKWIIEIGELAALSEAAANRVKEFLTQTWDTYKPPYARQMVTRPRRAAFFGTTNDVRFLHDPTGARRFLPLVGEARVKRDLLERDVHQLWAEAVHELRHDAPWFLDPEQDAALFGAARDVRQEIDDWEDLIAPRLRDETPVPSWMLYEWVGCPGNWRNRKTRDRIEGIMRRMGWKLDDGKQRTSDGLGIARHWRPKSGQKSGKNDG